MQLQSGNRLGPYEIVERVGAGGMGEVYRARDTRLARSVAIKVLPAAFAGDVRLRARLEQEAKTISALNHLHICTLHDVGRDNGIDYLVMEYCEGQTLADRLERGALPLRADTGRSPPGGARWPRWALDGKTVFYRQGDSLFAVPISVAANDVRPGKARLLFTMPGIADYDVTKEGFLIAQSVEELHETRQINVILNWKRELSP